MSAQSQVKSSRQWVGAFPGQGTIVDLAGRPVDANSEVWRLNDATSGVLLDWRRVPIRTPELLEACVVYAAQLVRYHRPKTVRGWFSTLLNVAALPRFADEDVPGGELSYALFSELLAELGGSRRYLAQRLKGWYVWCCDQGYPHFNPDTAFRLTEITYGGNEKAKAVLSVDPEEGPLSDVEVVSLLNALRASEETGKLELKERVAVWLCVALGCNAHQYALLWEDDLERMHAAGRSEPIYQLRVPRMKKRHAHERAEFKVRKLIPELGRMVEELQMESRRRYTAAFQGQLGKGATVPLFLRNRARNREVGEGLREYAISMTAQEFTNLVAKAVDKLGVVSPRTGKPLRVTCRRFRYTFATRLVREGASQRAVAEALDHTDLQNVQCYFDLKSDMVEKLDAAMAMTLGPVSQAFLGHLVRTENEAVRGDEQCSRIYHHRREAGKLEAVGTCGSFSFCGFAAPTACYTCIKFQPWMEAPHSEVLEHLLAERSRREAEGLDGKMVALLDTTILAIADVVSRVEAAQQAKVAPT